MVRDFFFLFYVDDCVFWANDLKEYSSAKAGMNLAERERWWWWTEIGDCRVKEESEGWSTSQRRWVKVWPFVASTVFHHHPLTSAQYGHDISCPTPSRPPYNNTTSDPQRQHRSFLTWSPLHHPLSLFLSVCTCRGVPVRITISLPFFFYIFSNLYVVLYL